MGACSSSGSKQQELGNGIRRGDDDDDGMDVMTAAAHAGERKKIMLLLDTTGSMTWKASPNEPVSRENVVHESIKALLRDLGGSVRTVTFSDGTAFDIGDLTVDGISQQWRNIRWQGSTYIMPGVNMLYKTFQQNYQMLPDGTQQKLLMLVITDGEAEDVEEFDRMLMSVQGLMYVELAVLGYGPEHDAAYNSFLDIAKRNRHVRVTPFNSHTNPDKIAKMLYKMIS